MVPTPSFLEPHPDTAISVFLLIRLSTTPVASSTPTRPWFQLSDASPFNMPYNVPEDDVNHRYEEIYVDRIGAQVQEVWKVRLEYAKAANDGLDIMGYAHTFEEAEYDVDDLVASHTAEGEGCVDTKGTDVANVHEYTKLENGETMWYFWEIVKVPLRPVRSYGIKDAEMEKERLQDLEWGYQEWAKKKKKMEDEGEGLGLTEEENDRRRRMGIVDEEDLEDERVMGVE